MNAINEMTSDIDVLQKTILHIEDNQTNIRLLHQILKRQDQWQLHDAFNAEMGLKLARSLQPDVILLDINLPDIKGFQVLLRLQNDSELKSIPVIAISASATDFDKQRGRQAGFVDYLEKPINIPYFLSVLHCYL